MGQRFWLKTGLVGISLMAAGGLYFGLPKQSHADGWQRMADAASPELIAQVTEDHLNPNIQIDVGQMPFWRIQQPGQPEPLYLIDSRVAETEASPLCGQMGCAFFGYVPQREGYQSVFSVYLDPRLPPDHSLFEVTSTLQNELPVLQVQQLSDRHIEQLTFAFNGQRYEVVEIQQLPETYD